jgi:hypothetical protein
MGANGDERSVYVELAKKYASLAHKLADTLPRVQADADDAKATSFAAIGVAAGVEDCTSKVSSVVN